MPTTPRLGLYYPVLSDDPDVPDDMRQLAFSVENASIGWAVGDFKFSFQAGDHDQFIKCDGVGRDRASLPAAFVAMMDSILGIHVDPTKVKIPNFKRRSPMGADPGGANIAGVAPNLGNLAGEELHLLLAGESGVNSNGTTGPAGNHSHGGQDSDVNLNHLYQGGGLWFSATAYNGIGSYIALGSAHHHDINPDGVHSHPLVSRNADNSHNNVGPVLLGNWFIATGGGSTGVGGGGGGLLPAVDQTYTTAVLATNARQTGVIPMANGYCVRNVATSRAARVRLYVSTAKRDADAARPITVDPPDYPTVGAAPDHGCMLEVTTDATHLTIPMAPNVNGHEGTGATDIPITVDNLGAVGTVTVTVTYQRTE